MTLNLVLLIISALICFVYLIGIYNRYGLRKSISAYAKFLTLDGLGFFTYVFIWIGLCFPLAWVANHWLTTIAAAILTFDGLFTGYNPNHLKKRWQDFMHLLGVRVAVAGFIVGIFFINWIVALATLPFGAFAAYFHLKKIERHNYWVEIFIMIWLWLFLLIDKVILY